MDAERLAKEVRDAEGRMHLAWAQVDFDNPDTLAASNRAMADYWDARCVVEIYGAVTREQRTGDEVI